MKTVIGYRVSFMMAASYVRRCVDLNHERATFDCFISFVKQLSDKESHRLFCTSFNHQFSVVLHQTAVTMQSLKYFVLLTQSTFYLYKLCLSIGPDSENKFQKNSFHLLYLKANKVVLVPDWLHTTDTTIDQASF